MIAVPRMVRRFSRASAGAIRRARALLRNFVIQMESLYRERESVGDGGSLSYSFATENVCLCVYRGQANFRARF